jgi:hypothetical protein
MITVQIDSATKMVLGTCSPPTTTPPIAGRYHIDIDEAVTPIGPFWYHHASDNTFKPEAP